MREDRHKVGEDCPDVTFGIYDDRPVIWIEYWDEDFGGFLDKEIRLEKTDVKAIIDLYSRFL